MLKSETSNRCPGAQKSPMNTKNSASHHQNSFLLTDISELYTLAPLAKEERLTNIQMTDLGKETNAYLAVTDGKIVGYGRGELPKVYEPWKKISAEGRLVLPGFVDSHTHPIFGGTRSNEFLMRMNGASYQEIAEAGGGIRSSMTATRNASNAELEHSTIANLNALLSFGVTAVECKTGYGLSPKEELRLLEILRSCKEKTPQHLYVTCLALHAKSPEFPTLKAYAGACSTELLPLLKKEGLADAVDAFIEQGYFSVEDVREFFLAAKKLGLAIRLHADEFSDAGGGAYAAEIGAVTADHLQFASQRSIELMAKAGVIATLLPGSSLYTKIPFTDGSRLFKAGVAIAIASDFNPGSCVINNLSLIATTAAIQSQVPPAAVLAGVTYVPAVSLGLKGTKGALAVAFDADFTIWSHKSFADWLADFGREKPRMVYIRGHQVN
jgi:imidazolonepropionase